MPTRSSEDRYDGPFGGRARTWFRWRAAYALGDKPALYARLAGLLGWPRVVDAHTDLVLEGFPRSSNSFARWALTLSQPPEFRLAHHRHVPAQIVLGVSLEKPVLVLIREPRATCVSFALFTNGVHPMSRIVRWYVRFYEVLLPHLERNRGFVVATFDQVTDDFGDVIDRLNRHYGTRFATFAHTEENVRRCFAMEREDYQRRHGSVDALRVAHPTSSRSAAKASLYGAYDSDSLAPLRARAEAVFTSFESLARR